MIETHITMTISSPQVEAVLVNLKAITDILPDLIELNADQRKSMAHYSDKDLGFIQKAMQIAEQHPEIFPSSFKLEAMQRDVDTLEQLNTLLHAVDLMSAKFQDSRFAAGNQSLSLARTVYQFVKTHHQLTGTLEDAVANLAKQYSHTKAPKVAGPAPVVPSTAPKVIVGG